MFAALTHWMVRVAVLECEKLPLLPVMVKVCVPVDAFRFTEIVRVELPDAVTGLELKLAMVLGGNPLTLRLTELVPPLAPSDTV